MQGSWDYPSKELMQHTTPPHPHMLWSACHINIGGTRLSRDGKYILPFEINR